MFQQLATVFALVLANAFFVASEFALVSVRRTRVDQLAAEGSRNALAVQRAVKNLSSYIAATQTGVTVASLLLGGLGEHILEPLLSPLVGWMPGHIGAVSRLGVATGLAYLVMTTLHVVMGELMPKSIALQYSEVVALWVVRPMTLFVRLATPLVWVLNGLGGLLLRLVGIKAIEGETQVHSPEELDLLFRHAHQGGEINETEFEILHRVVRFSDVTAREIMIPRVEMQGLPLELPAEAVTRFLHSQPHTRVPVYQGSLDDIVGIAHLRDLVPFESSLHGQPPETVVSLHTLVRDVLRLPETVSIDRLLVEFKRQRQQMAIVIDEYGGTAGLVTMGDLLEQVFGDVHDDFDEPEPEVEELADGTLRIAGRVTIDEINERFGTHLPADEADTMAGLVLAELGRPAEVGDAVQAGGSRVVVEAVDRLRITLLRLHLPGQGGRSGAAETTGE